MNSHKKWVTFLLILSLNLITLPSLAAVVQTVKGKKALISLDGEIFEVGQILNATSAEGKTAGLIKVTRVKGNFAEGVIKGKVEKGQKVAIRPKSAKKSSTSAKKSTPEKSSSVPYSGRYYGGLAGFNSTSAEIKTDTSGTVKLDGTGMSLLGFVDYELLPAVSARVMGGYEQFSVAGATGCNGECTAKIGYLALDAWARYTFLEGKFRPWAGGGFYMLFPMSKSASAIKTGSITNTSVFAFGGGVDIMMGTNSIIPVMFEYDLYPSSNTVKASAMAIRAGYGVSF